MNANQFIELVRQMRASQKHYFVTRSQEELKNAKALERQVDFALEEFGNPSLF